MILYLLWGVKQRLPIDDCSSVLRSHG
jgi:hypothetical protein